MERLTAEFILENEDFLLTPEVLFEISHSDLKILAKQLFEIKNLQDLDYPHLYGACVEKLNYEINRTAVREFMNKKDNQVDSITSALRFRDMFGRNWFTPQQVRDMLEKSYKEGEREEKPPSIAEINGQLHTLSLFNLVKIKKYSRNRVRFKIILTEIEKAQERSKKAPVNG